MNEIQVERAPSQERLDSLGVFNWPVWEKENSDFPWHYDSRETCFLLEGEVEVTPENGKTVRFGAGDLVIFPAGMDCHWRITRAVRKHYRFD